MAIIKLSVKRDTLKKIVEGIETEHIRDMDEVTAPLFIDAPVDQEGLTDEQIAALCSVRTDIELVNFQCGRNIEDGFALVEVKKVSLHEYVDESNEFCDEFYFSLDLGRILKTNYNDASVNS